jgi:predicted signal transduction protein with EAL and GGDEF domain
MVDMIKKNECGAMIKGVTKVELRHKEIIDKLDRIEGSNRSAGVRAVVLSLQSLAVACFGLAYSTKDIIFFYMGFGIWVFTMVIFIGDFWYKRKKPKNND